MVDTDSQGDAPVATVEYELTDEVARQMALDLVAHRIVLPPTVRIPAFRGLSPVVVLLAAAAQIVVALAALLLLGGWDWIVTKLLAAASVVVIGTLLWKAAFYGLPSFARWYASRRAVRDARARAHRRIRWLLYDDRLETESASASRRIAWPEIAQMTTSGQSVILSLKSGLELVAPKSVLSAETQSFIAQRISGD
jgi:hypothetical protein